MYNTMPLVSVPHLACQRTQPSSGLNERVFFGGQARLKDALDVCVLPLASHNCGISLVASEQKVFRESTSRRRAKVQ